MTGRLGLALQSDKAPGDYARIALHAESYGIGVLSVYSDLMYQPPLAPLLEMAAVTDRAHLGPACLNPYSMHPYEIAGQIAALDLASAGRAFLGLARGAWLDDVGIDQARPLAHLLPRHEIRMVLPFENRIRLFLFRVCFTFACLRRYQLGNHSVQRWKMTLGTRRHNSKIRCKSVVHLFKKVEDYAVIIV